MDKNVFNCFVKDFRKTKDFRWDYIKYVRTMRTDDFDGRILNQDIDNRNLSKYINSRLESIINSLQTTNHE